ncbi:kunitz-type serine protease inhibitor NACI-like [Drosophila hydei]|uniref:Kunitz-type serine protease inhibitor NACI-like n=1 Tax=Drosophila hydei TaxID=7224 RepID=A0A6J1LIT2_DROHY|nr:kunitz-type serine protease inhibitor NACI-like [Drosophila hydei]XP_023164477.1 kunitz-type serine protease inhibitor NACI-like [Drosophila hydei]
MDMKFCLLLIGLALFAANIEARSQKAPKCVGQPIRQACKARRDQGHNSYSWCKDNAMAQMWYYNMVHNSCNKMIYQGCGGNFNRYCSEDDCAQRCIKATNKKKLIN